MIILKKNGDFKEMENQEKKLNFGYSLKREKYQSMVWQELNPL